MNQKEYPANRAILDAIVERARSLKGRLEERAQEMGYCPHSAQNLKEKTTLKDMRNQTQIYFCRGCGAKLIFKKGILKEVIMPE